MRQHQHQPQPPQNTNTFFFLTHNRGACVKAHAGVCSIFLLPTCANTNHFFCSQQKKNSFSFFHLPQILPTIIPSQHPLSPLFPFHPPFHTHPFSHFIKFCLRVKIKNPPPPLFSISAPLFHSQFPNPLYSPPFQPSGPYRPLTVRLPIFQKSHTKNHFKTPEFCFCLALVILFFTNPIPKTPPATVSTLPKPSPLLTGTSLVQRVSVTRCSTFALSDRFHMRANLPEKPFLHFFFPVTLWAFLLLQLFSALPAQVHICIVYHHRLKVKQKKKVSVEFDTTPASISAGYLVMPRSTLHSRISQQAQFSKHKPYTHKFSFSFSTSTWAKTKKENTIHIFHSAAFKVGGWHLPNALRMFTRTFDISIIFWFGKNLGQLNKPFIKKPRSGTSHPFFLSCVPFFF